MPDEIYYAKPFVTDWFDSIVTSFTNSTLIGCADNTANIKLVVAISGDVITLNNVAGLFVGSIIEFNIISGTQPPELVIGFHYMIKTIVGNDITIAHDVLAPAVVFSSTTANLSCREVRLSTKHPVDVWEYNQLEFYQTADKLAIPLIATRSVIGGSEVITLTTEPFGRGTTMADPMTIYNWGIMSQTNQVIGCINLSPEITLTSSQIVIFSHEIKSQPSQ